MIDVKECAIIDRSRVVVPMIRPFVKLLKTLYGSCFMLL